MQSDGIREEGQRGQLYDVSDMIKTYAPEAYQAMERYIDACYFDGALYGLPSYRDMAAQAGKLLDYSAHAWESFTAITLAYVLINAFIMLVMTLVERKVRLPGNMGGK